MRITDKMFLGLLFCLIPFSVFAQNSSRADFDACTGPSFDEKVIIPGCYALISDTRLSPKLRSFALERRGFFEYSKNNFDRAAADFREAIRLDQNNYSAHHELGMVHFHKNEWDAAITAMDAALRLEPKSTATHFMRGQINLARNQAQSALLDFNRAIHYTPDGNTAIINDGNPAYLQEKAVRADYFRARATANFILAKFLESDSDFSTASKLSPAKDEVILLHYLAKARAGDKAAVTMLQSATGNSSALSPLAKLMAGLFLDQKKPDDVTATASSGEQKCTANFFVGQWHMLNNRKDMAKPFLVLVRDNCNRDTNERAIAVAQLTAL